MSRRVISTGSPFERGAGYSRAVVSGEWCFVSGTTGYDYAGMVMPDGAAAQARAALATIDGALAEAGFAMDDVVRARYIVADRSDVADVFAVLGEVFGKIRPAATMSVGELIEPAMRVEIDVTAHRPAAPSSAALSALIGELDEATARAERALDETLALVAESNARIDAKER